jgi:predicted aspartyl protease
MTYVTATARGPAGSEDLDFLFDSGAMYTLLPWDVWRRIGLSATREQEFSLADGTHISRSMSECEITLPQGRTLGPVILGEPGDEALLGVVTLEFLGLMLNPLTRELLKMKLRL